MKASKKRAAAIMAAAGLLIALLGAGRAGAQEPADWRVEFEAVCATTDASMSYTAQELTDLIARCDKLAERIGAEEETVRKVYLRRLKMCRDLLVFVLDSKAAAQPEAVTPAQPAPAQPEVVTPAQPEASAPGP